MKDNQVLVLILIPQCDNAGNGDGANRVPRSRTSTDRFRDGWERIFSQAKGTSTHDININ